MKPDANDQATGIIGMGLMGSALMTMTGAEHGWDVNATRCVNATVANDVFGHCAIVFLCLPNSDIVRSMACSQIVDKAGGDKAAVLPKPEAFLLEHLKSKP